MKTNNLKMDLKIATEQLNAYLADPSKYQSIEGMVLGSTELSIFPTSDVINDCDLESEKSVAISKKTSFYK